MRFAKGIASAVLVCALASCSESITTAPTDHDDALSLMAKPKLDGGNPDSAGINCQVGCLDQDPYPLAPGYFLGSGVTPELCYLGDYTDGDQDGLGDFCEEKLAGAFAPQLYYAYGDNVARESRWAARPSADGWMVVVAYMIGYYRDEGSMGSMVCTVANTLCAGHNGDSEGIYLWLKWNAPTQHWTLEMASYSQHHLAHEYDANGAAYAPMQYPDRPGGYPRAWVAMGKHANYATRSECNSGAQLDQDNCESNDTAVRLYGSGWLNVGSRTHPFIDCVASTNTWHPEYGNGRTECYWTNKKFYGWYSNPYGPEPEAYSVHLGEAGF